jgi:hypothetical protein
MELYEVSLLPIQECMICLKQDGTIVQVSLPCHCVVPFHVQCSSVWREGDRICPRCHLATPLLPLRPSLTTRWAYCILTAVIIIPVVAMVGWAIVHFILQT